MAITSFTASPAQKIKQQNTQQQVQNLQKQGWGEFGEIRAEDIKIEIPLIVQAKPEEAVKLLKEEAGYLEKRVDYDLAEVLEAKQAFARSNEFSAFGSMPINAETIAEQTTETQPDIIAEETDQSGRFESPEELEENTVIASPGSESGVREPSLRVNSSKQSQGLEPLIEDSHTSEPKVYRNDVDLVRHHSDVDFPYFFGWLGGQFEGIGKPLGKTVLNTKQWVDTKTALIDELLFNQVFGWGQKKELTKEEKERQQTQATNKRMFFDALKTGAAKLAGSQRRGSLKSRLEALNRNLKRGNLSYEGDLDETGQIRENVLIDEEKANSQKTEEQLKAEKKKRLMWAGKSAVKKGPGISLTADKSHNFNNAAKLAG